jgi:glucosylceramidase
LQTTAFINPDGSTVVIVLNTTEIEIDYHLWGEGKAAAVKSLPHSITTLVICNGKVKLDT